MLGCEVDKSTEVWELEVEGCEVGRIVVGSCVGSVDLQDKSFTRASKYTSTPTHTDTHTCF